MDGFHDLVRRFWVPVWTLSDGQTWTQQVLQYPVCQLVVGSEYARLWGVAAGMGTVELSGHGWVVGLMLQPAAGALILDDDVSTITDTWADLSNLTTLNSQAVVEAVRTAMSPDPTDPANQDVAVAHLHAPLAHLLPIDDEGHLVNRVVTAVEQDSSITLVDQLAHHFGMSPRALQRLTRRRLGLGPKWLIQRRRLHEAALSLKAAPADLSAVAADLGYADQAHFTHDFKRVTGMTPGTYRNMQ